MKKLIFLSLYAVIAMHAASSSGQLTPADCEQCAAEVTINRAEFASQSGFVVRGMLGYCLPCCPQVCAPLMCKRLKEKDLLYKGAPLGQSPLADEIFAAFIEKKELTVCPFRSKKELEPRNRHEHSASTGSLLCSPVACGISAFSAILAGLTAAITGSEPAGAAVALCCCASCCYPYASTWEDAYLLFDHNILKHEPAQEAKKDN